MLQIPTEGSESETMRERDEPTIPVSDVHVQCINTMLRK
jgi:hypothetical protein